MKLKFTEQADDNGGLQIYLIVFPQAIQAHLGSQNCQAIFN